MSPVPAILPSPPLTNCNCFDSYKREAANRQRLLVDDNPTRWERFWYRLLEDTRKYSRLDSMGYFQIDHRLLIMYQASLRRCWHTDPEWIKRKHWDRSAPWCWNLRNWYGIEPCEHWAWRVGDGTMLYFGDRQADDCDT